MEKSDISCQKVMENNYLDILNSLQKPEERRRNDHILIIDGLNMLIRCFSAIKTVNPKGHHVGGLTGSLKSIGTVVRKFNPTRVIVAWDGKGGASNRKAVDPNYKAQRVHSSVIHWDIYDSKEDEMNAMKEQCMRLEDYLSLLPVTFLRIDKLEADDIIAYLALNAAQGNHKVTIVSSDRDFLQLVNENIQVFKPTNKDPILYTYNKTVEFLGLLPENYNIVKAIIGDKSDNLIGVKGVGIKTLLKFFPLLGTLECTLDDVFNYCEQRLEKKPIYANILSNWKRVETNFKLMDLHESVLDDTEKELVYKIIKQPVPQLRIGPFMQLLEQDCITGLTGDTEGWLSSFSYLQYIE